MRRWLRIFAAVVCNDLRLFLRRFRLLRAAEAVAASFVLGLWLLAHLIAFAVFHLARHPISLSGQSVVWALLALMMLTSGIVRVLGSMAESDDATLLLSSPAPPRAVLSARLTSQSLSTFVSIAIVASPAIDAAAWCFGAQFLWGYAAWLLLAILITALCAGFVAAMAHRIKPHRARNLAQSIGVLLGIASYLAVQTISRSMNRPNRPFLHHLENGVGRLGFGWVARAGAGDPLALIGLLLAAAVAVGVMVWLAQAGYVLSVQEERVSAAGIPSRQADRPWRDELESVAWRKELRLLRRNPAALLQALGGVVYYIPLFFVLDRRDEPRAFALLALVLAVSCSPMLTSLCVDGEEGWDLVRMSPTREIRLRRAKVAAGMTLPALAAVVLCAAALAFGQVRMACVALPLSLLCAAGLSWLQASRVKLKTRSVLQGRAAAPVRMPLTAALVNGAACTGLLLVASQSWPKILIGSGLLLLLAVAMALVIGLVELKEYRFAE